MGDREPDAGERSDEKRRQVGIDPADATETSDVGDVARQLVDMIGPSKAARFLEGSQSPVPDWVIDQLGALAASDPSIPPVEDFRRGQQQFATLAEDLEEELDDRTAPETP